MNPTARRIGVNLLTALVAVIGMIACFYLGMFLRIELDSDATRDNTVNTDYVTVVHEDGSQTWERIGTLCPAGTTEVGEWTMEEYLYSCT